MLLEDDVLWGLHLGDAIPHMHKMPEASVDFAIYSPPFPSVFAYTSLDSDLGNSEDLKGDAPLHFGFFFRAIRRVVKPGRVMLLHCTDIHRSKRSGHVGLYDFHGLLIRLAERAGFVREYTWAIRKPPQAQAIRTRKWELKFQGLETDRCVSRGALPDYLVKFVVPGENAVPVDSVGEVSRNDWIEWAEHSWNDIRESDTLNNRKLYPGIPARPENSDGEGDIKHICPLQIGVINRGIRLYTNPGDIVFSPFAGVGSELFEALRLGRRAYGCELKPEYHEAGLANMARAVLLRQEDQKDLFAGIESGAV